VKHIKKLLKNVGIDPERLEMFNLSAAMGPRWAEICRDFTERIAKLGPSPIRIAIEKKRGAKQ